MLNNPISVKVNKDGDVAKIEWHGIEHVVPAEKLEVEQLIAEACSLKELLDEANEVLKPIKDRFITLAEKVMEKTGKKSEEFLGIAGVVKVALKDELVITNHKALAEIFGEVYDRYVNEETVYKPTKELRNLISDGDYEHKDKLRENVAIKLSYTVSIKPKE
ncbi:MAG: hypothetical protein PWQ97_469 [Tepidanaerobacteraceae bacterium]|nr:hypothetical protein [Tepidanaerobacteraceae bacterium]